MRKDDYRDREPSHEHRAHGPKGCVWCQLLTPSPASEHGYVTYENVEPGPAERRLPRIIPLEKPDPEIWITTEPAGQDWPWAWLMSRIERVRARFRQPR